jgi:hypothetical protein
MYGPEFRSKAVHALMLLRRLADRRDLRLPLEMQHAVVAAVVAPTRARTERAECTKKLNAVLDGILTNALTMPTGTTIYANAATTIQELRAKARKICGTRRNGTPLFETMHPTAARWMRAIINLTPDAVFPFAPVR